MNQQAGILHATRQVSLPAGWRNARERARDDSREELRQAIKVSNQVLATATTVLSFFPNTFTLDRAKLTVTTREFFRTAKVMSIRIEDILNVTVNVVPFFGSIKVVSRVMNSDKSYTIGNFWRRDALRLKRITQGYVIALQRKIDCSSLPDRELAAMLDKLGEDNHNTA